MLLLVAPRLMAQGMVESSNTWTFHTGEGYSFVEYPDPDTGKTVRLKTRCHLGEDDPQCLEKVYQFDRHEILRYVAITEKLFEARRDESFAYAALSAGIFIVSGKTFVKVFCRGGAYPRHHWCGGKCCYFWRIYCIRVQKCL